MAENLQRNHEVEVDMLAAAREAQWSATTFMGPGAVKLVAPAKVNLVLAIGQPRPDGYHNVETVMHALALHDTVYLRIEEVTADEVALAAEGTAAGGRADVALGGPTDNLLVSIDLSDRTGCGVAVPAADNLAFKAADRLARAVGRDVPEHVQLRIEKHIPAQAGLGGGSSDAAAVLMGLANAWGLAADDERVVETARSLGADVAFFLYGGCAQLGGTGDALQRRLAPSSRAAVLVKPPAGVSTAAAYRAFDENPAAIPAAVTEAVAGAISADEVPLFNNLAPAAEQLLPELAEVHTWLVEQAGSDAVLLSGSGSATFALVDSFSEASRIATAAGARGWWGRPTTLSGLRAALVPGR